MEATRHYWFSLYSFLVENHFVVHVINPIQTDGWCKGTEIRKRKTDIIVSVLIANFIRYGDFLKTSLADEDTISLRNFSRLRNYFVFKAYYHKKRSEGKHHNVAVGAVACKLCPIIYAVLKNNVPYEVQAPDGNKSSLHILLNLL